MIHKLPSIHAKTARHGANLFTTSLVRCFSSQENLLSRLSQLDVANLCDADKIMTKDPDKYDILTGHVLIRLFTGLIPLNLSKTTMAGIARTVKTSHNDLLAVLRGLEEAQPNEVLVVQTYGSKAAVAGELFCAEAQRKNVKGLVIDGPMRDTAYLSEFSCRCYATTVSPYAGTARSPGEMQVPVVVGGLKVEPGDILVGDNDGVIVGSVETMTGLLPLAENIRSMEADIKKAIADGVSLHELTNYREHLHARLSRENSDLEFRLDSIKNK